MPQFKPKVLSSENSQSDEAGYMTKDELKKLCECDLFCDGTFLLYSTGNQSKHTRAHIINSARNINKYYRVTGKRKKPPQIESQRHQKYRFQCIFGSSAIRLFGEKRARAFTVKSLHVMCVARALTKHPLEDYILFRPKAP